MIYRGGRFQPAVEDGVAERRRALDRRARRCTTIRTSGSIRFGSPRSSERSREALGRPAEAERLAGEPSSWTGAIARAWSDARGTRSSRAMLPSATSLRATGSSNSRSPGLSPEAEPSPRALESSSATWESRGDDGLLRDAGRPRSRAGRLRGKRARSGLGPARGPDPRTRWPRARTTSASCARTSSCSERRSGCR